MIPIAGVLTVPMSMSCCLRRRQGSDPSTSPKRSTLESMCLRKSRPRDLTGYRGSVSPPTNGREANGTAIVTGTQYRRQTNYIEAINRIHNGEIGEIIAATIRAVVRTVSGTRSRRGNE